jgi:hypothetical protein
LLQLKQIPIFRGTSDVILRVKIIARDTVVATFIDFIVIDAAIAIVVITNSNFFIIDALPGVTVVAVVTIDVAIAIVASFAYFAFVDIDDIINIDSVGAYDVTVTITYFEIITRFANVSIFAVVTFVFTTNFALLAFDAAVAFVAIGAFGHCRFIIRSGNFYCRSSERCVLLCRCLLIPAWKLWSLALGRQSLARLITRASGRLPKCHHRSRQ